MSITADVLADNIAVMSDPDHVRGAVELICVKSRPTLSNCPSGLATTTGYTTNGLCVSIVTHGMAQARRRLSSTRP